jgi:LPS O-antigen subunit length determinant protein (WzzB/FepE family)
MDKSENSALVISEDQFDDELSLHDVVVFIRQNVGIILGGVLIGGVLGLALAFVLPAQWEGNTLIRIGQLGDAGGVGSAIEPPLQVVDRIKNKSFQNDVLKNLGMIIDEGDSDANLFRDTLKVKLEKSELIRLSLRGKSLDEVKLHIDAVVNELKNIHVRMSVPTVNRWHQELEFIEQELKHANAEAERLAKLLGGQSDALNDRNFSQAALLSNILIAREGELRGFHDRKRMLEERLSPERTFATNVMGRLDASQRPVFPKKSLFTIAGSVMGLFLGVLLSILRSFGSRSTS